MVSASHSFVTRNLPMGTTTFSWTSAATSSGTKKIRRIVSELGRFIPTPNIMPPNAVVICPSGDGLPGGDSVPAASAKPLQKKVENSSSPIALTGYGARAPVGVVSHTRGLLGVAERIGRPVYRVR